MYQQGKRISSISNLLDIPRSTVDYIVKKFNRTGSAENLKRKPRQCLIDDRGARILGRLVNSDRTAPLNEITARFNETRDVKVSARTQSELIRQWVHHTICTIAD